MHVPSTGVIRPQAIRCLATSTIPTKHGTFETNVFTDEHVALVYGRVRGAARVPVRVHSECMTSEVFGSLKCDCKEQLDHALGEIVRRGAGVLLYMRQEGRGIGLANKIRAYHLQSLGADTVDANRMLGLPDDARSYEAAAEMLEHLGVRTIALMTNNPSKEGALRALGVDVVCRIPLVVEPNPHSLAYLETKRVRMAHLLPVTRKKASSE